MFRGSFNHGWDRMDTDEKQTELGTVSEAVSMRLMVAIPANQRSVARIVEKNFQTWGFHMAVTKNHVGFLLMP
jgi:hypothetical protein